MDPGGRRFHCFSLVGPYEETAERRGDVKVWFGLKDKRELGQLKASLQAEEQPLLA